MIYGTILISASIFLVRIEDATDVLINISALLVLIEIPKVFGGLFKIHLETYHEDLTSSDGFMKLETTKYERESAYSYTFTFFMIYISAMIINYVRSNIGMCLDFDSYYDEYYVKQLADSFRPSKLYEFI